MKPSPLIARMNKAMYAGGGSPEAQTAFDDALRDKVGGLFSQLDAGELDSWADTPEGMIGLVLLCDQMSRNIFRDKAAAWSYDARAQKAVHDALENPVLMSGILAIHPVWVYLFLHVFMHAESNTVQELGVKFVDDFEAKVKEGEYVIDAEDEKSFKDVRFYMWAHAEVVRKFGRFPSRNVFLSRVSTPEEEEALAAGTIFGSKVWNYKQAKDDYAEATKAVIA